MSTRRAVRTSLLVFVGLAAFSAVLSAQSAIPGPTSSILTSTQPGALRAAILQERGDSVERDIRPAHWKEGALIGGLVGVAAGALLGAAICRNSEQSDRDCSGSTVGGGLIVGLVLAIPGALIGGQIPKGAAPE
jgi:hypothetical protein